MSLANKRCVPCTGGVKPLSRTEAKRYLKEIPEWELKLKQIAREFKFKDFAAAKRFVDKVAGIAEREGHHPDILLYSWNRVRITLSTHAIKGLSENDFIEAAKIDRVARQ